MNTITPLSRILSFVLVSGLCAVWVGCSSPTNTGYQSYLMRVPNTSGSFSPASGDRAAVAAAEAAARVRIREIVLSSDQVSERSGKLQLVSIRSDLTTTIRTPTGEVVTGRPGDFFACREYGSAGLQLVAASPQNGEALFEERVVLP